MGDKGGRKENTEKREKKKKGEKIKQSHKIKIQTRKEQRDSDIHVIVFKRTKRNKSSHLAAVGVHPCCLVNCYLPPPIRLKLKAALSRAHSELEEGDKRLAFFTFHFSGLQPT